MKKITIYFLLLLQSVLFAQTTRPVTGTVVYLGPLSGNVTISKDSLISIIDKVSVLRTNTTDIKVVSFDIALNANSTPVTMASSNNKLTPEMKYYIKMMKPGNGLYIENVKINTKEKDTSGKFKIIPVPGINIQVK